MQIIPFLTISCGSPLDDNNSEGSADESDETAGEDQPEDTEGETDDLSNLIVTDANLKVAFIGDQGLGDSPSQVFN